METYINILLKTLIDKNLIDDVWIFIGLTAAFFIPFFIYKFLGIKIGYEIRIENAFPYNVTLLVIILFFVFWINSRLAGLIVAMCEKFGRESELREYYAYIIAFATAIILNLIMIFLLFVSLGKKLKKRVFDNLAMPFLSAIIMWIFLIVMIVLELANVKYKIELFTSICSFIVFIVGAVVPFVKFMLKSYDVREILYVQRKLPIRIKEGKNKLVEKSNTYTVITYNKQCRCIKQNIFPKDRVIEVVEFFSNEEDFSQNKDLDIICSDIVVKFCEKIKNLYEKTKDNQKRNAEK